MRRVLCSAALLAAASLVSACATNLTPGRAQGPQGTIVGVISLPQGLAPTNACEHLQVFATNAQGQSLGDSSVVAGRENRCSYTLNYVEANVPLHLTVGGYGVCHQGTLSAQKLPGTFQLQERETKLADFAITCAQ